MIREQRLAAQKTLGLLPDTARLTERNPGVAPWESLSKDERRLYTALQENYAAFVDNLDQNVGRLRDYLAASDQLDNTIFIFLSDNGASREVGVNGTTNVMAYFHNRPLTARESLQSLPQLGESGTHPHYPHGWMQASNTPFAHAKRTNWAGGIRVSFIVSWPDGIHDRGDIRHQFHHVNDIAPTLLDLIGIAPPEIVGGRHVKAIEGVTMVADLQQADAPTTKKGQYYEIEGQRAYTQGEWKIVNFRKDSERYNTRPWMLFNLSQDPAETNDVAAKFPDKLEELKKQWWSAAERYDVLPMIDMPLLQRTLLTREKSDTADLFVFERDITPILVGNAPSLAGRTYTISTELLARSNEDEGVLLAVGDTYSGYSLYIQKNRLIYELNVGHTRTRIVSDRPVPTGNVTLAFHFSKDNTAASKKPNQTAFDPWQSLAGSGQLLINGETVGEAHIDTPLTIAWEGLDVGQDRLTPVSNSYAAPFRYTGTMQQVKIQLH